VCSGGEKNQLSSTPGISANDTPSPPPTKSVPNLNRDQAKAYTQGFITGFPDLHFELTQKVDQGEYVVINWVGNGTHTGPLPTPTGDTLPATGKKATVVGSTTYQIKNGKAVKGWTYWDMVSLLSQLGMMPGMSHSRGGFHFK
jgi:predicted ester cyclase